MTSSSQWDGSGSGKCHLHVGAFNSSCATLQPFLSLLEPILQTLGEMAAAHDGGATIHLGP